MVCLSVRLGTLTLFIMSELIINWKLATVGPGHFELQKYPPKRKLYEKVSCLAQDSNLGPLKFLYEVYCSTSRQRKQDMKFENEFFMSMNQIELMINYLMMNQLENISWWIGLSFFKLFSCHWRLVRFLSSKLGTKSNLIYFWHIQLKFENAF